MIRKTSSEKSEQKSPSLFPGEKPVLIGDAYRPFSAVSFGDIAPSDRLRAVASSFQPFEQFLYIFLQLSSLEQARKALRPSAFQHLIRSRMVEHTGSTRKKLKPPLEAAIMITDLSCCGERCLSNRVLVPEDQSDSAPMGARERF